MRYAITWLALAITIVVVVGRLNWPGYRRLAAVGVPGRATVVEVLPNIHNTVRYEYRVDGRAFQGQMQSWRPNPPLPQLAVGHALVIYYDPQHPEDSVLGYPKPMLQNETISVALAAVIIPTVMVVSWAWRSSRKHADKSAITPEA